MKKAFFADKIFLPEQVLEGAYVLTDGDRFVDTTTIRPRDYELVDLTGCWIAPGLVDTHIHGLAGYDVMDNHGEGLERMSVGLLSCGVTSFLPTTLTSALADIDATVSTIGQVHERVTGARIQGIFIEGPFFTEKYKGAQNPAYFMPPSITHVNQWQALSGGLIRKVALAPEHVGSEAFVRYLSEQGIVTGLAHSDASYEQAMTAVNHGASVFVHTFNGMSGLHHREPGMVGAAMSAKSTYKELICDWFHVHPATSKLLMEVCGRERIVLISDSIKAALMPEGRYNLGDFEVTVADGQARLYDGTLAGSTLLLKDALKNVVDQGLATPHQAINMATINAAKSVGIEHTCGRIATGLPADFVVLRPNMELVSTYLGAQERYKASV